MRFICSQYQAHTEWIPSCLNRVCTAQGKLCHFYHVDLSISSARSHRISPNLHENKNERMKRFLVFKWGDWCAPKAYKEREIVWKLGNVQIVDFGPLEQNDEITFVTIFCRAFYFSCSFDWNFSPCEGFEDRIGANCTQIMKNIPLVWNERKWTSHKQAHHTQMQYYSLWIRPFHPNRHCFFFFCHSFIYYFQMRFTIASLLPMINGHCLSHAK